MCSVGPIGNDPLYSDAWHLENTGQKNYAILGGTPGYDVKAKPVIDNGIRGKGIKVAVSDSGIEVTHEDLGANFSPQGSKNFFLSSPYDGIPIPGGSSSGDAHGTAVTGIIAAVGGNDIGARGVAPDSFFGGFNYLAPGVNPARWPYQVDGPFDIFNYSYGRPHCILTRTNTIYRNGYQNGVNNLRNGKGALYVKAAGNDFEGPTGNCGAQTGWLAKYYGNSNFDETQNYQYLLLAGAMNANGVKSSYSTPGSNIWVSAPGGEFGSINPAIQAPDLEGCNAGKATSSSSGSFENGSNPKNSNCNYTAKMNGTSSAAPNTSGVIALMLSANPSLTWRDVKHILATHSTLIDFPSGPYNHPGGRDLAGHIYQNGWVENAAGYNFHNYYGFGLVNAQTAVTAAMEYKTSLGEQKEKVFDTGSISQTIPNNSADGTLSSLTTDVDYKLESVSIIVSLTHPYIDNIGIELYSPAGTKSIVLNINSSNLSANLSNFTMVTNAFYGESSLGKWTLKVIDGSDENPDGTSGDGGTLTNWKLVVKGNDSVGNLTSQQKPPKHVVLSKNRVIKKLPAPKFTSRKSADPSERYSHPADPFLVKSNKDYFYAANVWAILEKDYQGPVDRILGDLMGLKVITSPTKPKKGYYVVKSKASNRLGIYTGYIFAHGNNAEIEKALRKKSLKWEKTAGIYIIPIRYFQSAYTTAKSLRFESPTSRVELAIYYLLDGPL
jgi:subtilisin family serine protease